MTNRVRNTARIAQEHPIVPLMEAVAMGPSAAIEASERRGQQELVTSDVLPCETREGDAAYERLGFTFGPAVNGDDLFRAASLPPGWQREGSDHAMWSYIVDERGIRRVGVFYKAAYYDRRADMHIISVGGAAATNALYGDEEPTAASLRLGVLTEAELADFRKALDSMRADIERSPTVYGKYAARLAVCDSILAAA